VDRQIRAPLDPLRALDPDEQTFGAWLIHMNKIKY
jgi:hypothetical protein